MSSGLLGDDFLPKQNQRSCYPSDLLLIVSHRGLPHTRPLTPPLGPFCIAQGDTSQHDAQHIKNACNAAWYSGDHWREIHFSLGRFFPESKTAGSCGVCILALPSLPLGTAWSGPRASAPTSHSRFPPLRGARGGTGSLSGSISQRRRGRTL